MIVKISSKKTTEVYFASGKYFVHGVKTIGFDAVKYVSIHKGKAKTIAFDKTYFSLYDYVIEDTMFKSFDEALAHKPEPLPPITLFSVERYDTVKLRNGDTREFWKYLGGDEGYTYVFVDHKGRECAYDVNGKWHHDHTSFDIVEIIKHKPQVYTVVTKEANGMHQYYHYTQTAIEQLYKRNVNIVSIHELGPEMKIESTFEIVKK